MLVKQNLRQVFQDHDLKSIDSLALNQRDLKLNACLLGGFSKAHQFEKPHKQFLMVNIKDCDNNFVKPRLPNNYKPNQASNYSHNGYLFNLEAGNYTIVVEAKIGDNIPPIDGKKWLIRAVSPHALLQKL